MTTLAPEHAVKKFYQVHTETNWDKRYGSPYRVRRYFFRRMWDAIMDCVEGYPLLLDAGCGDGVLSVLWAERNPDGRVIAMDISEEGVQRARKAAEERGVLDRTDCVIADAAHLPFKAGSIPALVSSHVLEHLPRLEDGLDEVRRVTRERAVIALPAALNASSMVLLGGDDYWRLSRRTPFALLAGLGRVFAALVTGKEGVQEGYGGHDDLPHLRTFPWRTAKRLEKAGLRVREVRADSLLVPYVGQAFPGVLRLQARLDRWASRKPLLRHLGVGMILVVEPEEPRAA